MMKHSFTHLIYGALTAIGMCVALNLALDPYALFGTPRLQGFNKVKAVIGSKQRVFETVAVLERHPEAIILGTSRSDIGLDPQHPAFAQKRSFNAAASGQPIRESRELLQAVAERSKAKLKEAVIGLDFMAFNALSPLPFDYSTANFSRWRKLELLFSLSTTLDALRTLQRQNYDYQLGQGGLLRDDGFREYIGNPNLPRRAQFDGSDEGFLRQGYKPPPHCAWRIQGAEYDAAEEYRALLSVAHQRGISLKLFISPSHARQWETLAAAGLWREFEEWKRMLVRINVEEARKAKATPFTLWDFSGYNTITTEPIPKQGMMRYYWESSHYRMETGNLVLDQLYRLTPVPAFGQPLTPASIEPWLEKTRQAQRRYRANNPQEIGTIKALAAGVAAKSPCRKP
jgi:hypothetical protein